MALSGNETHDLYDGLKYNFLFNSDINCIHILLNLYDLENNINNIFPRYVSMNYLRKSISRLLKDRKGNHLIAYNLGELIHEDVNRLELFLYLEGYRQGYLNKKETNSLENLAIKHYSVPELYNLKYLYHYETNDDEIAKYKSDVLEELVEEEKEDNGLYTVIRKYCNDIIKPKVLGLNKHLDKQLTISLDSSSLNIKDDYNLLTLDELNNIYDEVYKIISKKGEELFQEAYWNGLNDRLLKRYK